MKIFIDPGHAWDKRRAGAEATGEPLSPAAIFQSERSESGKIASRRF